MIDPLIGQHFGQYEVQDRLGHGGMAAVYRALQPALGRAVAIKVMPLARLPDPSLPERFRREARMAANLMHPNIVPVYDFGEWQGLLYIVMALIPGGTLKERIQGPLPAEMAVRLVAQVSDGLGYAHGQGIFHRDVKPTNVLLAAGDWAMLSDFGIARALGETTRLTSPYGTIGTPAYMAPEQWLGGEIDGRADLYSLGIVLFELLTGSPPFTATTSQGLMRQHLETAVPSLATRRPDLPRSLDDILQTVLAKDADQRYRHAGELRAALLGVVQGSQALDAGPHTQLVASGASGSTSPYLGQTIRVSQPPHSPAVYPNRRQSGGVSTATVVVVGVLVALLAAAVGYIAASGRLVSSGSLQPTPTIDTAARVPLSTPTTQPPPPTSTPPLVATPTPVVLVVTATAPPSTPTAPPVPTSPPAATPAAPTEAPQPTARPPVAQPTVPAKNPPTATATSDPRFALIERHVADYFAALNAGDFARAQAVCCTPGWRSRYPLDEWRKNFAGVTDLRFVTPFRYTSVEVGRIVAEVDYSFANTSGARRFFTLRWTFVPVSGDWLADDAVAAPQR